MVYIGNSSAANFSSVTKDTFSGNGSTTAFTLSKTATTNGVAVYVENVRQIPTTAYAVSGTTLTFTAAPVSGTNNIYVMHHNTPVSTATHPASQDLTAVSGTFSAGITSTSITATGDVSLDGGSFVFNESGANKDFRIEGDTNANLFVCDASHNHIGIGIATPTFADGNGLHLADDFYIGFGNGNGTRPDYQFGYDATNTRFEIRAGTGSDDEDLILTTGGRLGMGATNTTARLTMLFNHSSGEEGIRIVPNATTATMMRFDNSGATQVGSITSSGSSTAFNTSSDYRLKENVTYSWDATSRLKQLKPARFNFINDDTNTLVDGFLAHEVSSIVPESITGNKDAVRDIGKIENTNGVVINEGVPKSLADTKKGETWTKTGTENIYQSIDQSKLVPLLVKTIQELEARVTALESK
jgi:hypothetical protein